MNSLRLYSGISKFGALNYRAKIMIVAFVGTHVPLIGIIAFYLFRATSDMGIIWATLAVALCTTLLGTAVTLFVLDQLLQPVFLTSKALRAYRMRREIAPLPTGFRDEAGTLMADASATLTQLEASLVRLETTDPATGLPNRRALLTRIDTALAAGDDCVVLAVQMASVARVAASYDQMRADALVRLVAQRLGTALGPAAFLGRVDGGTLGILIDAGGVDAAVFAERLTRTFATLGADIAVDGLRIAPDLRIGLARTEPGASDGEALIDNAVAAASAAESSGLSLYTPRTRKSAQESFELERELREAVRDNQFVMHF